MDLQVYEVVKIQTEGKQIPHKEMVPFLLLIDSSFNLQRKTF